MAAARARAPRPGFDRIITGDMGGTSFDVAVVIDGEPAIAETTLLDFRIPLRLPMIDVHTIGAGGGSIAYIDRGGILQVGPRSAGAVPGPVCFGRGGTEPTVTDANVVLGAHRPRRIRSGWSTTASTSRARAPRMATLGGQLGLGVEETAEAILAVVNQRMAGRIRLLSIERGHDPRDFALVAFGGAGPVHGAALMQRGRHRHDAGAAAIRACCARWAAPSPTCATIIRARSSAVIDRARRRTTSRDDHARAQRAEGEAAGRATARRRSRCCSATHAADMAYLGQIHAMRVPVEPDWTPRAHDARRSTSAYRREFGNTLAGIPVMVINVRTTVEGKRKRGRAPRRTAPARRRPRPRTRNRRVYFGDWMDTPIYRRGDLEPGMTVDGPGDHRAVRHHDGGRAAA